MKELFKLDGKISSKTSTIIGIIGFIGFIFFWHIITTSGIVSKSIFPSPFAVISSFKELYTDYNLMDNIWFSVKLNIKGYLEAVLIAIPLGFFMALIPFIKGLISKYFDALRFLPLPAVTGIFIAAFGIEIGMKVHFLAFGIMLYLIPVVVQRINEIEETHKQTMHTLGASPWAKIKHLYFPYAISKIYNDIRVLVAISWTYIVVAELINKEGGVGAMIFTATKQSRIDMVYALVVTIIALGFIQDVIMGYGDKSLFPFKYNNKQTKTSYWNSIKNNIISSKQPEIEKTKETPISDVIVKVSLFDKILSLIIKKQSNI